MPGALVGVVQGLVLTAAMAKALDLTPGGWVAFAALAALAGDRGLAQLSMGTSQDYAVAAGEGATIIRLGTVLYGGEA